MVMVALGSVHAAAVTEGGRVYTWGDCEFGQLGHAEGGEDGKCCAPTVVPAHDVGGEALVMAACGDFHTCVVSETGLLWTWGKGDCGQLGAADVISSQGTPCLVSPDHFGGGRLVLVMR